MQLTVMKDILQPCVTPAFELKTLIGHQQTGHNSIIMGSAVACLCIDAGKSILTNVAAAQPPGGRHDYKVA